jgi:formylglycine-generating enzyme required for sulfatase activity
MKRLLALFIWCCLSLPCLLSAAERGIGVVPISTVAPGGNAALFIGVNQFTEDKSVRSLDFAVNDAIAQAHLFVVDLKLIPAGNAFLALSGEPTTDDAKAQLALLQKAGVQRVNAVKSGLLRTFQSVAGIPRDSADLLVVSLSSHGFEERGQAYVMPADGVRAFLEDTAINLGTLEQRLAQSKAGKRLILVDACREKPSAETKGADLSMTSAFRSALAAAEGQAVLASCDAGQVSLENASLGHGIFTHFLLEALKGNALADSRGFITLGAISDYVARSVQDWVARNRPGLDRNAVQRPWFKGPKLAEQIPLAVDPGIRARLGAFKQEIVATVDALRGKINRKGEFTASLYDRLAEALEQAQDDEPGRNLLKKSRDFAAGKLDEDLFAAYLDRTLETPEQRATRLAREAADRAAREKQARISTLLASAQASDSKEKGKDALVMLDELLRIEPNHRDAMALRAKIAKYYGPNVGDTKTLDLPGGVKLEMVWIPPGEFIMGSNDGLEGEKPVHKVKISQGFWMGKYEVTQEQYEAVTGKNPSTHKAGNKPVHDVSWNDAVAFCNKIGARLPTEAEWEYACRAGTTTKYSSGDTEADLRRVADYGRKYAEGPGEVGRKEANPWGLYDLHGNVWEWCADWFGSYPSGDQTDPTGPSSDTARVLRGGSFYSGPGVCRCAYRSWNDPDDSNSRYGFRVVVGSAR